MGEEPQVTNISIENMWFVTCNRMLTSAETNFLLELVMIAEGNRLSTTSAREIAKKLNRSERRTRDLMRSLLRKSILFEGELKKGIYIHPEIIVIGDPKNIPLWLVEEVERLRERNGEPGWPMMLYPGKHRGVWRWKT